MFFPMSIEALILAENIFSRGVSQFVRAISLTFVPE
jgi:hypothetical protein